MKQRRPRRAMLLMSVLVCLTVAMVLFASWMKTITLEQRHVRAAQDQAQAAYLAASGLARAAAQLAAEPGYTGETWQIDPESLALRAGATVVIRVAAVSERPRARRVTVEASFPDEGARRARRTSEITLELPTNGESS